MRRQHPRGHHRAHQIALPAGTRAKQGLETQPAHGYTHGLHVAMRSRGNRLEAFGDGAELLAAQHRADGEDLLVGERG